MWKNFYIFPLAKASVTVYELNVITRQSKGEAWCPNLESHEGGSKFRAADPVDSEKTTLCINIAWRAEYAELSGLLGYLVELSDTEVGWCRLIWVPCVNCGGPNAMVGSTSTAVCTKDL